MPTPLTEDELTRVAAYLAVEKRKQQGGKLPPQVLDRVYTNRPTGMESSIFSGTGFSKASHGDQDREGLEAGGYRYLPQDDFDAMRQNWNPVAHEGKPAPQAAPAPAADPRLTDAMAQAATAAWLRGGPPSSPPPPARATASGAAKRRREVSVSTTSSTGPQPAVREFQPLAQLAPADAAKRLEGLPEGVAFVMRKRWGLEDAQADSNRRALAVELASAGNQVGSGLAGGKYEDSTWNHQRAAAGQPVEDYQARSNEERAHNEEARRAAEDEREAHAAAEHARMELERFEYGKTHDKAQDQLARDRMTQEGQLASDRLASEGKNRALQREDMRLRQTESAEAKKEAAAQKRQDMLARQDEKDQAELAKREGASGEMASDIRTLNDAVAKGREEGDIPGLGVWDSWKMNSRSLPARAARTIFASPEDYAVSEAVNRLSGNENRALTGLASSDAEREENKRRRGLDAGASEEASVQGLQTLARDAKTKLRNVEAGFGAPVVNSYARRGAQTSRDIPEPLSRRTGRTIARADGSVWAELDNGEAEMVSPPRRR